MDIQAAAKANMDALRSNVYPGRGIVIGCTPDGANLVQVYWIMGRSENSRNRIFVTEEDTVCTAPFDESKVEDPSLIIYNCIRVIDRVHIVSNGNQTDTIFDSLRNGETFETALFSRTFEPDEPNYTPRIAGLVDLDDLDHTYKLGILKTIDNDPDRCVRHFYNYAAPIPGIGHFIATYSGDGSPLPSFEGEPQPVEIADNIDTVLETYWSALNADNKVSLLVKFIGLETSEVDLRIANKHEA